MSIAGAGILCAACEAAPAAHMHHRKLRSQGGNDEPENLLPVCVECHTWIHANPGAAYELGLLVHSWDDPADVPPQPRLASAPGASGSATRDVSEPMQTTVEGDEVPHRHVVDEQGVEKVCPKCHGDGKIIVKARETKKSRSDSSPIYNARTPKNESRETLIEDEEHLTDLLVKARVLKGHEGARWWVIHYAYRFALQNARAFVREFQGSGS